MSKIPDPLYLACLPFLAISKGRQMQLSSPFGDRGAFFVSYQHREEFDYYEVPAEACSRIDPDWLAEQRETMGEWYYQSEFCCKFMSSQDACFRREDIDAIISKDVAEWTDLQATYQPPAANPYPLLPERMFINVN